jgi:hypothetical protein
MHPTRFTVNSTVIWKRTGERGKVLASGSDGIQGYYIVVFQEDRQESLTEDQLESPYDR